MSLKKIVLKRQYDVDLIDYVTSQNDANPDLVFLTVKGVL